MRLKPILLVLLLGACAWQSSAQPALESSGNYLLNGAYYMRQVLYYFSVETGALADTVNIQGTITFTGSGTYTFTGSTLASTTSPVKVETFTTTGSYTISASGEGYINAVDPTFSGYRVVGMVSNGIFIGSEGGGNGFSDLFVAVPIASAANPMATNATLSGAYTVAYMDPTFPGDALFTMTADGQGNIGSVSVNGYTGTSATAATQSLSGVTYSFTNGAAAVKFGGTRNTSTLVAGDELLYVSPDGNFIFGGNYSGYDMFVGVRSATSPPTNFNGLYYQAGLDLNESTALDSFVPLNSYYGAFQALSGKIIGHRNMSNVSPMRYQNLSSLLVYGGASDFTYSDSYTLNSDGSSDDTDFNQHYLFRSDGTIRLGYGIGPFLSINVALQAPAFSGSGVYLSPVGMVNAASSAPFTAQLSPGEFLTLYGTGLASTAATASLPFPTMFNGVQVFINQIAAPIYYLSPTQISVVVPYLTVPNSAADIYVVNNGATSNLVTQFTGLTSVGVFTNNPVGGLGYAAALHPDFSVISPSSPAQIGEIVAVYLAGMGAVRPPVMDGTPASSSQLSYTTSTPLVFLLDASGNYLQAPVAFSGLAPGFAGLYQINFTVPSGLVSGNATLEIIGQDSDTFQALLPLSTGGQ